MIEDFIGDVQLDAMVADSQRPKGLTASTIGTCHALAGFKISEAEPSDTSDAWDSRRGTYLHAGILAARKAVRPYLRQEERVTITIAGIEVSGAFDDFDPSTGHLTDVKTRDQAACHARRLHGVDPGDAMSTAVYAKAVGADTASVLYVPIKGGFDEWVECHLDVDEWFTAAQEWLATVVGETQENLPRDKPSSWCERFCGFYTTCRGGWTELTDLITDPVDVARVHEAWDAREAKKAAVKREEAAMADIDGLFGHTPLVKVSKRFVEATETRRAYVVTNFVAHDALPE